MSDISRERITRIERVEVRSSRPRDIGFNSRKGAHGTVVHDSVVRVHTASGAVGVGWSPLKRAAAESLLGRRLGELFHLPDGSLTEGVAIDLPLWDLAARLRGVPLYRLLGARGSRAVELYDGSIYIDDLDAGDGEAQEIFREEVRTGHRYGYRNFKIKIGRGARWMPTAAGLERDVLVIHTVREAAGPDAKILVDANNGGTLNSTKDTLTACAGVGLYWFEEPFAEDPELNADLKQFIRERGYPTLVADGESGPPPPTFFAMVEAGDIDVVQHDFRADGADVVEGHRGAYRAVGRVLRPALLGLDHRALRARPLRGVGSQLRPAGGGARRHRGRGAGRLGAARRQAAGAGHSRHRLRPGAGADRARRARRRRLPSGGPDVKMEGDLRDYADVVPTGVRYGGADYSETVLARRKPRLLLRK